MITMFSLEREQMTSGERLRAVLAGQKPDRVPFIPFALGYACVIAGYEVGDFYADPEKSFRAQLIFREVLGHDGTPTFSYASFGAYEFGGKIKYPYGKWDQAPIVIEHPIKSPEDVQRLVLPPVNQAGYIPNEIKFARLAVQNGFPIMVKVGSPFTTAGSVIGEAQMMRWMIKYPELVHEVLRKVTDFLVNVARYFVEEFGSDKIIAFDGAPTEASQVISPRQFEEFALPYLLETHGKILGLGVRRFLTHVCGEQNLNLLHWRKVPVGDGGVLSFGHEVDLDRAIELFGQDVIIAGNINPTLIQTGTPEEVYELTRVALLKGKKASRGFILMPGCELPVWSPWANVYYLRKAVNDFGFYD
jgi:uroporphyrinogen decarboxylase